MSKRVLITGVNGFVGSHLAEACVKLGWAVYGTVRSFRSSVKNLIIPNINLIGCDITDYQAVAAAVKQAKPNYVFHLAAQSFVPSSWIAPTATINANINGTLNVLEAVRAEARDAVVQVAGSSEEYGHVEPSECPITENNPLRPLSPYGVSKVAADVLARQFAASYGMRIVVTRAFNHTGPRRGAAFAESQWARDVALIEAGVKPPVVQHGNLDAIRDFTDARDIVRGYIAAVERGKAGEVYNLCSGPDCSPTMREVLGIIIGLSKTKLTVEPSPKFMRPSDVQRLIGNCDRARADLGWTPTISIGTTLTDLLNYWRADVEATKEVSRR